MVVSACVQLIVYLRYTIMARSKANEFGKVDVELAKLAKALSHPARIAILKTLAKKRCICGEIVNELPLAQASVSQHLKELKEVGLVTGEVDGPSVCYCLNDKTVERLKKLFGSLPF